MTNCDGKVDYSEPYEVYEQKSNLPGDSVWNYRIDLRQIAQKDLKSDYICIDAKKLKISGIHVQVDATNGVGLINKREVSISCQK